MKDNLIKFFGNLLLILSVIIGVSGIWSLLDYFANVSAKIPLLLIFLSFPLALFWIGWQLKQGRSVGFLPKMVVFILLIPVIFFAVVYLFQLFPPPGHSY